MALLTLQPAATEIAWEIIKGESFTILVPVLDAGDQPVDVTGWTAKSQVRRSPTDAVLHEWSSTFSNISLDSTGVSLIVDGAVTATWAWADALVSVVVYEPTTSKPHTVAQGQVRALPQITQNTP